MTNFRETFHGTFLIPYEIFSRNLKKFYINSFRLICLRQVLNQALMSNKRLPLPTRKRYFQKNNTKLNLSLQVFSQDYNPASHNTYVVCVNFIHESQDLQFKVHFQGWILEKLFIATLLFHPKFLQEIYSKEVGKRNFFQFRFVRNV